MFSVAIQSKIRIVIQNTEQLFNSLTSPRDMSKLKEQFKIARQTEILDAAIRLFSELGYENTSIRQVAQAAEIADGTIYYYFENKQALLIGIIERLCDLTGEEAGWEIDETIPFQDYMTEFIEEQLIAIFEYKDIIRAITPQLLIDQNLRDQLKDRYLATSRKMEREFIERLIERGEIREIDPHFVSDSLIYLMLGTMAPYIFDETTEPGSWNALAIQLTDLIMNGVKV